MAKTNKGEKQELSPASTVPLSAPQGRFPPHLVRFLWIFPLVMLVGFGLLLAPFLQPFIEKATGALVTVTAASIRLLGGHAQAQANLLRNPISGFTIEVKDTCNASNVTILLWAAILAFPAPLVQKLKGAAVATVMLHVVNVLRIVSLFYLGQFDNAWFEFAHLYIWEGLIVLVTLVLFWIWVQQVYRTERAARA
jgi:exosortase H (IPTLxxWG-CTERM-specific)